jgi:serine/threonine protein kinase
MTWNYCYKIKDGHQETTNLLYTPLKNSLGDILCMKWDINDAYQDGNKNLDQDLVNFFFDREVKYLTTFRDRPWVPEIKEIDLENKKILLEWNTESINAIINDPTRSLEDECPNWRDQIFNILDDVNSAGYYKLALYPHCFFINRDGIIKTIDFYSVIEKEYPFVERKIIEGMIGKDSTGRFDQATDGGVVNFKTFFEITMLHHLEKTWIKDNPFPEFYRRLIND